MKIKCILMVNDKSTHIKRGSAGWLPVSLAVCVRVCVFVCVCVCLCRAAAMHQVCLLAGFVSPLAYLRPLSDE